MKKLALINLAMNIWVCSLSPPIFEVNTISVVAWFSSFQSHHSLLCSLALILSLAKQFHSFSISNKFAYSDGNSNSSILLIYSYVYDCFACMHRSMHHICTMSTEVRRRQPVTCAWNPGWLGASMWVLGTEPRSSARPACFLHH